MSTAPCCPPASTGYLAAGDYVTKGKVVELPGVTVYATGSSESNLVFFFSDIWGWNSGRVRALADDLAQTGVTVLVPKLLTLLEEGTDGEGLPPNFDLTARWNDLVPFLHANGIEAIKDKLAALGEYAKGFKKVTAAGFCYGGWVAAKAQALGLIKLDAIAMFHPSLKLEGIYGRNTVELAEAVKVPVLLAPGNNDEDEFRPNGAYYKALNIDTFYDAPAAHGWFIRGDISDPAIKAVVEKSFELLNAFLCKFSISA